MTFSVDVGFLRISLEDILNVFNKLAGSCQHYAYKDNFFLFFLYHMIKKCVNEYT